MVQVNDSNILDSVGGAFFDRELEAVRNKTYDVEYPGVTYSKVFPIASDVDPGATSIVIQAYDRSGTAKLVASYAGDLPRVDVDGTETIMPVRRTVTSFGYTIDEINASRMVGKQLDVKRAFAARMAIEELHNKLVWLGDTDAGLKGVFSAGTDIPRGNAIDIGTSDTEWSKKTVIQRRDDLNLIFSSVASLTKSVEQVDRICLPSAQYNMLVQGAISADNSMTLATWFVQNSPYVKSMDQFIEVPELAGAGAAGVDTIFALTHDPMKVEVIIPQDITFLPKQPTGLEYIIPVTSKIAGLVAYKPMSMYIMEAV